MRFEPAGNVVDDDNRRADSGARRRIGKQHTKKQSRDRRGAWSPPGGSSPSRFDHLQVREKHWQCASRTILRHFRLKSKEFRGRSYGGGRRCPKSLGRQADTGEIGGQQTLLFEQSPLSVPALPPIWRRGQELSPQSDDRRRGLRALRALGLGSSVRAHRPAESPTGPRRRRRAAIARRPRSARSATTIASAARTLARSSRATSRRTASDSQACDESGRAARRAVSSAASCRPVSGSSEAACASGRSKDERPSPGRPSQRRAVSRRPFRALCSDASAGARPVNARTQRRGEREIAIPAAPRTRKISTPRGRSTAPASRPPSMAPAHWRRGPRRDGRCRDGPGRAMPSREKHASFPLAPDRHRAAPRRSTRRLVSAS